MNTKTADHIDKLLYDSGLFPSKIKKNQKNTLFDFSEEIILITGAAGSIGSGLTKQLINCNYKKLILVDIAESPMYELLKELEFEDIINVDFLILNITDEEVLENLFKAQKPTIVFHTAAYKNVPMMEKNPYEAIKLNIFGTKLLADFSNEYGVKKFIFISTDKAVNPIGVMGISKKIGENYLNYLNTISITKYVIARFGNILGSNGSVVLLFKKQIEFGYPITITKKNITRYFISKHKACKLVLKIALIQKYDYNLFTFNMGKPIRITDIIERLLSFYKNLEKNPEIKIIGLRSGEKICEEIISKNETLIPTDDLDILAVKQNNITKVDIIDFTKLENIKPQMSNSEIKNILLTYI